MNDYPITKGERREAKRRKGQKMRVVGAGVRNLNDLIVRKAREAKEREHDVSSLSE